MKRIAGVMMLVLAAACDDKPKDAPPAKDPPPPSATATAAEPASASTSALASASASALPSASVSASASASASAPATASAHASASPKASASATPLKSVAQSLTGKNFFLNVFSPGCRAGEPCTMTLELSAAGDYHINKEYPYKFIATAAPNVTFLGKDDANTFSRAAGDFKERSEKAAMMTVRFKPTSAGSAKVSGTYKLSICSAENCQIEQKAVSIDVPVL